MTNEMPSVCLDASVMLNSKSTKWRESVAARSYVKLIRVHINKFNLQFFIQWLWTKCLHCSTTDSSTQTRMRANTRTHAHTHLRSSAYDALWFIIVMYAATTKWKCIERSPSTSWLRHWRWSTTCACPCVRFVCCFQQFFIHVLAGHIPVNKEQKTCAHRRRRHHRISATSTRTAHTQATSHTIRATHSTAAERHSDKTFPISLVITLTTFYTFKNEERKNEQTERKK